MADLAFNLGKKEILDNSIALLTDDIRVMLITSAYTPNANDDFISDGARAAELSGAGYTANGEALASKTIVEDDPNNRAEFDSADNTFTGIDAGTAAAAVIYKNTGVDTTSTLIAYIDSGGFPIVTNGGDLTITWNAEGIYQI